MVGGPIPRPPAPRLAELFDLAPWTVRPRAVLWAPDKAFLRFSRLHQAQIPLLKSRISDLASYTRQAVHPVGALPQTVK